MHQQQGLAHILPCYAGRSMQAELEALGKALDAPVKPVAAVVGGAKVSSKLDVLKHLVTKVDHLIIGGGMAFTFHSIAVGLRDLGEVSWGIEQVLNLWLRQEQAINDDLLGLIAGEHQLFTQWVTALENAAKAPDPSTLIALARNLRGTETLIEPVATPAAPAAPRGSPRTSTPSW
mgnify:CR=1 FL=1